MTVFAAIAGAFKASLLASPAVLPAEQIYKARLKPVAAQFEEAVVVRLVGGLAEEFAILNAPTDWDTDIEVECYARSKDLDPDDACDELLGRVYARLVADPTLGGLLMGLRVTSLEYDFASEAQQLSCVKLTLKALHRTDNNTLE